MLKERYIKLFHEIEKLKKEYKLINLILIF